MVDPLVGQVIRGRYRVTGVLGRGGMSTVYEVTEIDGGRIWALKRLDGRLLADPAALVRFQREAHIVSRLRHPHVVHIEDWALLDDGSPCMLLEYLDGESLAALLARQGPLPWPVIAAIADQIMSALDTAHGLGVIHCDVKPQNVLITRDAAGGPLAKLVDFGIARARGLDSLTRSDATMGTPAYMAPEQAMGQRKRIGPATDVWAMAAVVHEMAAGRPAFAAEGAPALVHEICYGAPAALAAARADAPPALCELIARGLARDDTRLGSIAALRAGLRAALAGRSGDAQLGPPPPRTSELSLDATMAASPSARAARTNIEPERDSFVGRAADEARVGELLDGGRLVTLLGPGGVGKTRLARRVARAASEHCGGGAWFVDLAEARDLDGVVRGLARVLEVPLLERDEAGDVEQLARALHARGDVLIVLDNLEQVAVVAAAALDHWLAAAPRARLLATSRQRLGVRGERCVELLPLPAADAGELLRERAGAIDRGFVDAAPTEVIDEIVRRLDGLPLAIELAAARANVLAAEELLARLQRRFDLLVGPGAADPRQRTLRAAIDWSWELLAPWERSALAQLSLFAAGFTAAAAERVVELDDGAPPVLSVLGALRDRSLVAAGRDRRLLLLESIREYAAEKLTGGARAAAERRSCAYHADLAEQLLARSRRADSAAAARRTLVDELENLLAAQRTAATVDPSVVVRIGLALDPFLASTGPYTTWLAVLDAAVAAAGDGDAAVRSLASRCSARRMTGDVAGARRDGEAALARPAASPVDRGWALAELARLELHVGDHARAAELLGQLRACVDAAGDTRLRLRELVVRGTLQFYEMRYDEAMATDRVALEVAHELGDPRMIGHVLSSAASAFNEAGRQDQAEAAATAAVELLEQLEDRGQQAMALSTLALVAQEQGRPEVAENHFHAALAIHRRVGGRLGESVALGNLAVLHHAMGRLDDAGRELRGAIDRLRAIDNRFFLVYFLANLGALEADRDRAVAAEAALEEAAELAPEGRVQHEVCRVHLELLAERAARALGDEAGARAARARAEAKLHAVESDDRFKASDVRIACAVLRATLSRTAATAT